LLRLLERGAPALLSGALLAALLALPAAAQVVDPTQARGAAWLRRAALARPVAHVTLTPPRGLSRRRSRCET
jgi:hypothetical protein